jgi:hypothetical protein
MVRKIGRSVRVAALVAAVTACSEAHAQYRAGAGSTSSPNVGAFANPYMNPYMNPYLNPYATTQQMGPGNAALYFFSAQAQMGGIGSGQISGVRPGPNTQVRGERDGEARPRDEARDVRGVPSSVSRYFQRGPQKPVAASFYNRQGRYYSSPRR